MLKYLEFIKEAHGGHYDSFFIKIISRKTPEEAIEILNKDSLARSFRREYGWEVYDEKNKILKVHLKDPEVKQVIERKVKGRHKDLKYVLHGLGDPITDIKATDKEKEQLKFLTNDRFVKNGEVDEIFIDMYKLFTGDSAWVTNYKSAWNDAINDELEKLKIDVPNSDYGLSPVIMLNEDPYNENLVKKGFELILKAINNGDLDIDPNWIKSLVTVKKFNIF